jgi:hypothetical protein
MKNRPVLYLDVVGTLLADKGGRMDVAPFAAAFVKDVGARFDVRILSALEEHQAMRVCKSLQLKASYVSYRHGLGKSSSIDFSENFFWVEDDPSPADLLRLVDERCSDRLIPVTRREGVTAQTLRKLNDCLETPTIERTVEME